VVVVVVEWTVSGGVVLAKEVFQLLTTKPCCTRIHCPHRCFCCDYDVAGGSDALVPLRCAYNGDDGADVCGAYGDGSHDVSNYVCGTIPFHFANLNDKKKSQ